MLLFRVIRDDVLAILRLLAGIVVSLLPRHWWPWFDRLPLPVTSFFSGLATIGAAFYVGITGFLAYGHRVNAVAGDGFWRMAERQAADPKASDSISYGPLMGAGFLGMVAFLFFTPTGWLALYLLVSGTVRAIAFWVDDPMGEPILTGLDRLFTGAKRRSQAAWSRRKREEQEGLEVPDRLYRAEWAGVSGADFVVVASRQKPDWTPDTCVIAGDTWYTIGVAFDMRLPGGLRTVYPLTEQKVPLVLRRGVAHQLPPLQESKKAREMPRE